MTRTALVALFLLPAVASAQGIVTPYRPPVIPSGSPGSVPPFPGFRPPPLIPLPGLYQFPVYWGGWGGWGQPSVTVINPPPVVVVPAVRRVTTGDDLALAAAQVPATLKLELPAAADVWLDGVKLDGPAAASRTIPSPPLPLGAEYTFKIKARWTADGTAYEVERTSAVKAGGTGKLLVVKGTPVK